MSKDPLDTPAMRQWSAFKKRHPECILMFRMGDFYELFGDDAVKISKAIGLTLTQRTAGLPMAGVPHHQLTTYLRKIIEAGFRVAIADQIQDPKDAKGVVDRAVTRVVTPGTMTDEALVDEGETLTLAGVIRQAGDERIYACVIDPASGDVELLDAPADTIAGELTRRGVRELVIPLDDDKSDAPEWAASLASDCAAAITTRPAWHFRHREATDAMLAQYRVSTLDAFGLDADDPAIGCCGAAIVYLRETQGGEGSRGYLEPPRRDPPGGVCVLDAVSLRALEVERTIRGGGAEGSLLGVFLSGPGRCRTPMGRRLLREWLCAPLLRSASIRERHRAVATLVEDRRLAAELASALDPVQDVARINGRLSLGRASPRELVALGRSVASAEQLQLLCAGAPALSGIGDELGALRDAIDPIAIEIARCCREDAPPHLREGGLIREGVDAELDEARTLQTDAGQWLSAYQRDLIAEFDLPSLKVGYNKVFGYYIELPAAQARRAPDRLTRKQTLKNAERYITPELKEFEDKVTTAESRAIEREQVIFAQLCAQCAGISAHLASYARTVARLDALLAFADKAHARGWVEPVILDDERARLDIDSGRHPVLDGSTEVDFVPNSVSLGAAEDARGATLALITGPNMAGKSTYIRQAALLALLAQAGSFVPAKQMTLTPADRIFTRVGADDALHKGQSTFMVEMVETAGILLRATPMSLVILDEIGRGTSTLDGLSLAWAIAERLAAIGCRSLFATHYHELTRLEDTLPSAVRNLRVLVREWGEEIVFMHRVEPGRAESSYGVQVARLAGVPEGVVARAREVLDSLRVEHAGDAGAARAPASPKPGAPPGAQSQLPLFTEFIEHPATGRLREVKLETLSPMQAFDLLRELQQLTRD